LLIITLSAARFDSLVVMLRVAFREPRAFFTTHLMPYQRPSTKKFVFSELLALATAHVRSYPRQQQVIITVYILR
jgi:hypothetical protein